MVEQQAGLGERVCAVLTEHLQAHRAEQRRPQHYRPAEDGRIQFVEGLTTTSTDAELAAAAPGMPVFRVETLTA